MIRRFVQGILTVLGDALESWGSGMTREELLAHNARLRESLFELRGQYVALTTQLDHLQKMLGTPDAFENGMACDGCGNFSAGVEYRGSADGRGMFFCTECHPKRDN